MHNLGQRLSSLMAKAEQNAEYSKVDRVWLSKLSDKELASWQSDHPQESPQFLLAQFEWNRRLTEKQVQSVRFAAWVGLIGVVLGAILGWLLSQSASR
jgi:hypothetical protein